MVSLIPMVTSRSTTRITDVGWGLLRVQVKTTSDYDKYRYELEISPERYPDGTVDIFAGAIHEEGTAIYVPAYEMGKTQRVNFNPQRKCPVIGIVNRRTFPEIFL